MFSALKFFDAYSLRARVFPALLAGLPALAFPFVVVPWKGLGLSNIIVTVMSLVLLYAFADLARRTGLRVERKLGTRSTLHFWHRIDATLPNSIKDPYRDYIATQLKRPAPTADDELHDPAGADDFYAGAGFWLRDQTRNVKTFNILFDDLVSYGFRRNLLGLKYIAVAANLVVAAASVAIIYLTPEYFVHVPAITEKLCVVLLVVLLHSLYMLFAVGPAAVREASDTYGKQLIISCGNLIKAKRAPRPKSAKE